MHRKHGVLIIGPEVLRLTPQQYADGERPADGSFVCVCSIHHCRPPLCFHLHHRGERWQR